ncbi:MAG: hypothetical protein R3E91_05050 [Chlamydiales bacterium]
MIEIFFKEIEFIENHPRSLDYSILQESWLLQASEDDQIKSQHSDLVKIWDIQIEIFKLIPYRLPLSSGEDEDFTDEKLLKIKTQIKIDHSTNAELLKRWMLKGCNIFNFYMPHCIIGQIYN